MYNNLSYNGYGESRNSRFRLMYARKNRIHNNIASAVNSAGAFCFINSALMCLEK